MALLLRLVEFGKKAKSRRMTASDAVVITGSSTGIGEACALHLGKLGFRVFGGVRKEADADSLEVRASGASYCPSLSRPHRPLLDHLRSRNGGGGH